MSIKRPSYEVDNGDTGINNSSFPPENNPKDSGNAQFIDNDTKHEFNAAEPESIPPPYDGEHDRKASVAVNTAEDLVTRVIDVEDDPTLQVWTFRMWFLGRSKQAALHAAY